MDTGSKPIQDVATDSIVLEEEIDPNYVPSEAEVIEYAKWLGMDLEKDKDLYWIAREGLMAPLPKDWKPCKTKDTEDVYYFNFTTGDSTWDHPCDGYYKRLYEEEKKKKETGIKESGDQNRSKAKQDVEQLLGKADKKKKKKPASELNTIDMVKPLPAPLGASKKPLPGIVTPLRASGSDIPALAAVRQLPKPGSAPDLRVTSSLELPRTGGAGYLQSSVQPLGPLASNTMAAANPARPHTAPAPGGLNSGPKGESARVNIDSEAKDDISWNRLDTKSDSIDTVDAEMGKLPITASLQTSSRVLHGSSTARVSQFADGGADGITRRDAAVPDAKEGWTNSRYDPDDREAATASGNSLSELQRLRDKCASLERQLTEREKAESQLRVSNDAAKQALSVIERRYEASQEQWRDKVRTLESENSALDAERRKLKFDLLDMQDRAVAPPSATGDKPQLETLEALQQELLRTQSALSRSVATHTELQQQLRGAEAQFHLRVAELEAERAAALAESERLAVILQEAQDKAVARQPADASPDSQRSEELAQKLRAADGDLRQAKRQLDNEQARCAGFLNQIKAMGEMGEAQARSWLEERASLMEKIEEYKSKLSAASSELDVARAQAAQNIPLLRRAEAAEAQQNVLEGMIADWKVIEGALRHEVADLQRRASEDQEQILALQAARSQLAATESERQQFETFTSQATAVRKALKGEIERLKSQLQDVEAEKSTLLTQLTRQETTLQFAKKELNDVATLREAVRQLETEKQQLAAQAEQLREVVAAHQAEEALLRERCDKMVSAIAEEGERSENLRAENARLASTLEGERSLIAQQEKKIKSYQEELLQLQRRLAEHVAAQGRDDCGSAPSSPVAFLCSVGGAPPDEDDGRLSLLQAQLEEKEVLIQAAQQERDGYKYRTVDLEGQVKSLNKSVEELRTMVAALEQQVKARTEELAESHQEVAKVQSEIRFRLAGASVSEEDALARTTAMVADLESQKTALGSQLRELRNQLSSAQLSAQLQVSTVKLAQEEAESYKNKWIVSERELSQLRIQNARVANSAQDEILTLRAQLDELRAINEVNASSANELRYVKQECSGLRAALLEKEAQLQAASAEVSNLKFTAQTPLPSAAAMSSAGLAPTLPPAHIATALPPQMEAIPSGSVHHIVALSLEMGRQQVSMQRMEEHLRNTERLLLELRAEAASGRAHSSDDSLLPSAVRKQSARSNREGRGRGRAEDHLRGAATPEPDSLLSPPFSRSQAHSGSASAESDSSNAPDFRQSAQSDVSRRWIASEIRRHDLHFHDGATMGIVGAGHTFEGARALAQRVLLEAKARLKGETKLLRDVQLKCAVAKRNLIREQEAVKNLKALWRSSRNRGSASKGSALTSDSINAVTALLNDAVDDLREAQLFVRSTESSAKSLSQSLQYLDEVVNAAQLEVSSQQREVELTARLLDISRSVQRKCVESANAMAAVVVSSARDQTDGKRTVSWTTAAAHQASPGRRHRPAGGKRDAVAAPTRAIPAPQDCVQPGHAFKDSPAAPAAAAANVAVSSAATHVKPPFLHSIRNNEVKARLLLNQIDAISQRQSASKDICEKHAGWLDTLQREINGASHRHSAAASVACKENIGSKRGEWSECSPKPSGPVMDYALGYEAKAHYSNSKRAFGDALNTIDANRTAEKKENALFLTI